MTPTEKALLETVQTVRDYLPPDGIGKDEFITRIIEAVDNPEIAPVIAEIEWRDSCERAKDLAARVNAAVLKRVEQRQRDAMISGMNVKRVHVGGCEECIDPADIYHTPPAEIEGREGMSRESEMATLRRDEDGKSTVWCDPEIADLVDALNSGSLATVASCSGHGHRPGRITLKDGRELFIAKDFEEADLIDRNLPFPDINGNPSCEPMIAGEDGWCEWIHPLPGYLMQCCDCGLIHEMEFAIGETVDKNGPLNAGEAEESVILFRARRQPKDQSQ